VRSGRAADHSLPSSAAVMEEYSYTSTHPLGHTGPVTGSHYLYFTKFLSTSDGCFRKWEHHFAYSLKKKSPDFP
jgi:hypothetical protein